MPSVGFEPTIPESARPQTYVLKRAATGIGFGGLSHSHIPEMVKFDSEKVDVMTLTTNKFHEKNFSVK
jgi:hypothetical protein